MAPFQCPICPSARPPFQREQALIKRQHQFHPKTVRARGDIAIRLEPHPEMGAIPELLRQTERLPRLARRRIQLLVSAANIAPAPHGYANLPLVANAASRGGHAAIPRQTGITVAALFIDPSSEEPTSELQ